MRYLLAALLVAVLVAALLVAGPSGTADRSATTTAQAQEGPPDDATHVEAATCGACHEEQLESWHSMAHSTAWESLTEEARADEECVPCHVTGMGEPGGFVSIEETPNMVGVQCTACHGRGSAHVALMEAVSRGERDDDEDGESDGGGDDGNDDDGDGEHEHTHTHVHAHGDREHEHEHTHGHVHEHEDGDWHEDGDGEENPETNVVEDPGTGNRLINRHGTDCRTCHNPHIKR